jgi:hypothetical protein
MAADKPSYVGGEAVTLRMTVIPRDQEARVRYPSVAASSVDLSVAFEKERFKMYMGPGWGLMNTLLPAVRTTRARPYTLEFDVFYQVGHVDSDEPRGRLLPEGYVFQRPGKYTIKAVLHDKAGDIQSPIVTISVLPPAGDDAVVWRELAGQKHLGHLLHTGVVPGGGADGKETRALLGKLSALVTRYPRSAYTITINRALAANQAARDDHSHELERILTKPEPKPEPE